MRLRHGLRWLEASVCIHRLAPSQRNLVATCSEVSLAGSNLLPGFVRSEQACEYSHVRVIAHSA
eukprot:3063685-Prymnesium_polylepis.1